MRLFLILVITLTLVGCESVGMKHSQDNDDRRTNVEKNIFENSHAPDAALIKQNGVNQKYVFAYVACMIIDDKTILSHDDFRVDYGDRRLSVFTMLQPNIPKAHLIYGNVPLVAHLIAGATYDLKVDVEEKSNPTETYIKVRLVDEATKTSASEPASVLANSVENHLSPSSTEPMDTKIINSLIMQVHLPK